MMLVATYSIVISFFFIQLHSESDLTWTHLIVGSHGQFEIPSRLLTRCLRLLAFILESLRCQAIISAKLKRYCRSKRHPRNEAINLQYPTQYERCELARRQVECKKYIGIFESISESPWMISPKISTNVSLKYPKDTP